MSTVTSVGGEDPGARRTTAGGRGEGAGVVGIVLAGGRGRRLGGSKALALLAGRPLVEHVAMALAAVADEVVIAAKADTALPDLGDRASVWIEPDEPRHPLIAITHGLRRAGGRPVLVCAVDLPLVSPELLGTLAAPAAAPRLAVIAAADGRWQPLLGRYEPEAALTLEAAGTRGRALDAVAALDPVVVSARDASDLLNVNDPADLLEAESVLRRRQRSSARPPKCGPLRICRTV